ncbi:MAG: BlaI/MecI/CopY family transcriptional regulator [Bacteroidota bacterium]
MKKLTQREDQIMQIVWRLKQVFIRDIIAEFPDPKPHYNTVATLVKILVEKGFLDSELIGNTHRYRPVIPFETYRDEDIDHIKKKYFGNSLPKMLAHFAKTENLSEAEVEALMNIIKSQKD